MTGKKLKETEKITDLWSELINDCTLLLPKRINHSHSLTQYLGPHFFFNFIIKLLILIGKILNIQGVLQLGTSFSRILFSFVFHILISRYNNLDLQQRRWCIAINDMRKVKWKLWTIGLLVRCGMVCVWHTLPFSYPDQDLTSLARVSIPKSMQTRQPLPRGTF